MSTTIIESRITYKYLHNKSKDWLCMFVMQMLDFVDHCREPKNNPREDGIIEGFIAWNPDENKMKDIHEYGQALKVYPNFDSALFNAFDLVPEHIVGRRPMINWLDQEGWRIKPVNLLYKV